jgi:hypothetical protein
MIHRSAIQLMKVIHRANFGGDLYLIKNLCPCGVCLGYEESQWLEKVGELALIGISSSLIWPRMTKGGSLWHQAKITKRKGRKPKFFELDILLFKGLKTFTTKLLMGFHVAFEPAEWA